MSRAAAPSISQQDASSLDRSPAAVVCTDPPYYDNVPYAELSDFFYIWVKQSLKDMELRSFQTLLVPKDAELVAEPYRQGGREASREFFENGMRAVWVRLRRRAELEETWDPGTDERLTVWEVTHHLSRRLERQGESGAAEVFAKVEGMTDSARALAYRLFNICERKKWAEEARPYNALIASWQQIEKLASESGSEPGVGQGALDM